MGEKRLSKEEIQKMDELLDPFIEVENVDEDGTKVEYELAPLPIGVFRELFSMLKKYLLPLEGTEDDDYPAPSVYDLLRFAETVPANDVFVSGYLAVDDGEPDLFIDSIYIPVWSAFPKEWADPSSEKSAINIRVEELDQKPYVLLVWDAVFKF